MSNPRNDQTELERQADDENNKKWLEQARYVDWHVQRWKARYDYSARTTPQGDEDQQAADRAGMGDSFRFTFRNTDRRDR